MPDAKALSDYFEDGGKWGEENSEVSLSAPKLIKAITDALLPNQVLFNRVFKVKDHFCINGDGKIVRYASIGDFRKAVNDGVDSYSKETQPKSGGKPRVSSGVAYRDFAISDVPAFDKWLSRLIIDDEVDVIIRRSGRGMAKRAPKSGIYSLSDFMQGNVVDTEAVAKAQADVIQRRKDRGEELGNSRKQSTKTSPSKNRK